MYEHKSTRIDISASLDELLRIMRENPSSADQADLKLGRTTLDVFSDKDRLDLILDTKPYLLAKQKLIREAIEDLANGGPVLMSSAMGIRLVKMAPVPFVQAYRELLEPEDIVFKIKLKDASAYSQSKKGRNLEMHGSTANASIYYLVYLLATEESAS